ncbi:MAG: hypothetical protein V1678_01055, partial [Candidatus Aenigmatarchaeota archaeon]
MKFVPILRLGTVEAGMLENELNGQGIFPLLEITNKNVFRKRIGKLVRQYKGDFMVDLPLYMLQTPTNHTNDIKAIIGSMK